MDPLVAASSSGLGWGALAAAFFYGVRHGFDLDHLAAITDITGSQTDRRRSLELASLYAAGHALAVLVLGALAIVAGTYIPEGIDHAMGRLIGTTLILLGFYVFYSVARHGSNAVLRSRWGLVAAAAARVLRIAARRRGAGREIVIEHEHDHDHAGPHEHDHPVPSGTPVAAERAIVATRARTHRHVHQHRAVMPEDPFAFGARASLGIGVIHGVGAETPTQVLLFATAAGVGSRSLGLAVLFAFVAGLVMANSAIALASSFGFLSRSRHPRLYVVLALATGAFSIVLGTGYLTT